MKEQTNDIYYAVRNSLQVIYAAGRFMSPVLGKLGSLMNQHQTTFQKQKKNSIHLNMKEI